MVFFAPYSKKMEARRWLPGSPGGENACWNRMVELPSDGSFFQRLTSNLNLFWGLSYSIIEAALFLTGLQGFNSPDRLVTTDYK